MSNTVIKVEQVSKQYRLGSVGTGTITKDIERWWQVVRGKEDPFLKIGEGNDRTKTGSIDFVWALKNINFTVSQGEVVGIIGRNGAGKSTLLKILSRTTSPTTGSIKLKGRVASLLEVGTGFHPELSGRENIFLNGAILGMTKVEIKSKFDEIVDFAGVERYIDTPVKRYSSGMYVRLAFAVAAHLEPEILIVDEVLAVGDAEFQKKCLGKMKDVSVKDGRTVLFVSHNMGAVSGLCDKGILFKSGTLSAIGDIRDIIGKYNSSGLPFQYSWVNKVDTFKNSHFTFTKFSIINENFVETGQFANNEPVGILIEGIANQTNNSLVVGFAVFNNEGTLLFWSTNTDSRVEDWVNIEKNENKMIGWIPRNFLNEGEYRVECIAAIHFREWIIEPEKNSPIIRFIISGGLSESPNWLEKRPGILAPVINFKKFQSK